MTLAAPHPDYREMHVFPEGAEMIREFQQSYYPAGELFREVFAAYSNVYVQHEVQGLYEQYRLYKETPVKQALEALGVADGVLVKIYADHRVWSKQVHLYGAGGPNNPMYWQRQMTADVYKSCGELFGPAFDQYEKVFIWSMKAIPLNGGIPQQDLTREQSLGSVLRLLQLEDEDVIDIYAE